MLTELRMKAVSTYAIVAMATLAITALSANADLGSQYGILDLGANGGINPNTGVAWQVGDQYRLAFYTAGTINAKSNDPAVYDNFATVQAQQNTALAASTGWTAMVWVNTDSGQDQGAALSSPVVRSGTGDLTGGAGQGGAGVPVYTMNGTTCIARNNADIYNSWSNPFAGDATLRLASGSTNLNSDGVEVVASQNVYYSPFLNQFGLGDTANVHGMNVWTGGFGGHVNALGDVLLADGATADQLTGSWGSSNANNTGRVWNRFTGSTSEVHSVYAISELLTILEVNLTVDGDTNDDGVVDAADYITLKRNFGTSTGDGVTGGNFTTGDTDVDWADLSILMTNMGAGSQTPAVPEPATLGLLAFGALAVLRRNRRS